jgi:pimeloyl-ACP methyl ester carboxylesterase
MRLPLLLAMSLLLGAWGHLAPNNASAVQQALAMRRHSSLAAARAELQSGVVRAAGTQMPIWFVIHGDAPQGGRSLYISLHGGGSAPSEVNDQQWENQKRLYAPEEGVYVAPRGPTDTWDLWHQAHMDPLIDRLIECMVLVHGVNPDRVYLMGYSAGGDGVFQLATRMADRFAAASMMAGHPNETRPDNLRNLPFAIFMGGKDAAFRRNEIAAEWRTTLDDLASRDPGGYPHKVTIYPQHGHWMKRDDAVALPWLAGFTRNARPQRIVWRQDDVVEPRLYWLENPDPTPGQRVVASRDGQMIIIEEASEGIESLRVLLDDGMLDLDKPVTVMFQGRTLHDGVVPRTAATIARTLGARGDPKAVFTAEVTVRLQPMQKKPGT